MAGARFGILLLLAFAGALMVLSRPAHADIAVRAGVNPQRAQVGEPLTLSIDVTGAQGVAAPAVNIDGFEVQYVGPATQISIVNGTVNSSVQHRYSLTPLRDGHFTLGPFTVDYQGKTYQTASLSVDITPAGPPQAHAGPGGVPAGHPEAAQQGAPNSRALRLQLSVPQQEAYLHQRLPLDVTLYVGPVRVGDVQYPSLQAEGLSVDKFAEPSQRQQVLDGETYQVVHFQSTVVPLRAGTLAIGPASLQLSLLSRRRDVLNDPFFQHFFQDDPFSTQRRPLELHSEPITLNVLPLPEEGKPPGFSGAVGTFTLQVSAAPAELTAGDPVTVRMTLNGSGNLADAAPPEVVGTEGFRAYETHASKPADGGAGSTTIARTFEQVLIPNDANVRALPPVRFSYFDPQARRYQTVQSQPIALVVRPPRNAPHSEVFAGGAAAPREERLGRDLVYIKDDPGRLGTGLGPWYESRLFLLWQPVPLLLFLAALWYDRRRQRLSGDQRYARFSRAGKQARRGLALAERALANGQPAAFYDAVSQTMQGYLAAKLDLPVGAIDADAAARRGVPEECVHRIAELLAICEQVRFAPGAGNGDLRGALSLARDIVRHLERQRGLAPAAPARAESGGLPAPAGEG